MNTRKVLVSAALLGASCFFAGNLVAQYGDKQSKDDMQMPEGMQAWMETNKPGKHHERLAKYAGKWNQTLTHWMEPGSEPMVHEGTYDCEMIFGGRYLVDHHSSKFMGMDFEGRGITGYDNIAEEYVSIWFDNMGTGFMITRGDYDPDSGKIVMKGEMSDPMSPTGKSKVKNVMYMKDNKTAVYEMYMMMNGEQMKTMEIISERAG